MLPASIADALNLDFERIATRSAYFVSYAEQAWTEPNLSVFDLIRLSEWVPADEADNHIIDLSFLADQQRSDELTAQLEQLRARETVPEWVRVAETADAWRQSAIADLLLDVDQALEKLQNASAAYVRLGLPYGWFLATIATANEEAAWSAGRWLKALSAGLPVAERGPSEDGMLGIRRSLSAPVQQVYVLLAAAADGLVVQQYRRTFIELAETPQARGVAPVSSTAQPIGDWWSVGLALARLHDGDQQARARLIEVLGEFGAAHGKQLERAQQDFYHWRLAHTRVDLVDLDLAGLVCLADRTLRGAGDVAIGLEEFQRLSPLGKLSLTVGLQLSRGDEEPWPSEEGQTPPRGPIVPGLPVGDDSSDEQY